VYVIAAVHEFYDPAADRKASKLSKLGWVARRSCRSHQREALQRALRLRDISNEQALIN
jgi:hypothetical protein